MIEPIEPSDAGAEVCAEPDECALLAGPAYGGPLDGGEMTSRRPLGVLLVDRPAGQCWLYEWRDGGFHARQDAPTDLVDGPGGVDNRERAAEEGDWDVQAAPWVGGDPDQVDPDGDPDQVDEDDDGAPAGAAVDDPGAEVTGPAELVDDPREG